MIDLNELRYRAATFGSDYLTDEEWVEVINRLDAAEKERDALRQELDIERGRLAACGVAALGYFTDCAQEYRSASLEDVLILRAKIEQMEKQEPVAWIRGRDDYRRRKLSFEKPAKSSPDKLHWSPLVYLPGAKAQPAPTIAEQDHINAEAAIRSIYDARLSDEALWQTIGNGMITPAHIAQAVVEGTITPAYIMHPAPSVQDVPAKSLKPVIDWLRNGCDPMKAADELEILIAAAPEAKL